MMALAGFAAGMARAEAPAVSLRPKARPQGKGWPTGAPDAADLIEQAKLGGTVSFSVADARTGRMLAGREADRQMPPASVTKVVTALYALEALGDGHRFETRILATGPVRDGVLEGDLVLAGGGDPVLDTDALAEMVRRLKEAGVRRVGGQFLSWGGALPFVRVLDPTQPEQVGYNPSLSGLNLNFNRVHFEWRRKGRGYDVTMEARSARHRPAVNSARMQIVDRAGPVYTYADGGDHDLWSVARGALGNGGSRWLPVRHPETYAAEVFARLATAQGIALDPARPADTPPQGRVLVSHLSPPLAEILRDMLKYSNNLIAELVGMAATERLRGKTVALGESAQAMTAWAHQTLGMDGARLVDHSGLGQGSHLSARAMVRALVHAHGDARLAPILKPFALRNKRGEVDRAHPVKVPSKTGTLYFVSSLAGYAVLPGGVILAFAIFTADATRRKGLDSRIEDRPPGAVGWNRRAKTLQQALIERWARLYDGARLASDP